MNALTVELGLSGEGSLRPTKGPQRSSQHLKRAGSDASQHGREKVWIAVPMEGSDESQHWREKEQEVDIDSRQSVRERHTPECRTDSPPSLC